MNRKMVRIVSLPLVVLTKQKTDMLMNEKKLYETPEVSVIKLKAEGMICASGNNWDTDELPGFEFEYE